MKKRFCLLCVLCTVLFLCACTPSLVPQETQVETTAAPETTIPETTAAVTETTAAPTEPAPSLFCIPGFTVEDVLLYFNEVCLDAEFTNAGDPSVLQKWDCPILYHIHGSPTEEDLAVLTQFTQFLNTIEGFPGIAPTQDPWEANLDIHFCTQEEMVSLMGEQFSYMDGGVTFWYEENRIYDAIICLRTDLDQTLRNSVILEELYNGLGPVQDTALRPDSIIYAEFTQPQALTAMDELILKLLYHPDMVCGMDAAACEDVIRQLYINTP